MNKLKFIILILLLLVSFLLSISYGNSTISISNILHILFGKAADNDITTTIILNLRLPRVILAMIVGAGLSISGCVLQGLLRNPLADPYTLGISGGAAFGAALGIITGIANINLLCLPLCAFIGTLICMFAVYSIASQNNFSTHTLILSGVVLNSIFSSMVLLLIALTSAEKVHSTIMWLMGDLSSTETGLIKIAGIFILTGSGLLLLFSRELNILSLGDEKAFYMGINIDVVKKIIFVITSLITAACVSVSGVIGFIGLIIPHIIQKFTGQNHKFLIPCSALGGAIFLPICDLTARTIMPPLELPVGVITGFLGGIFFLLFLLRKHEYIRN